MFFTEYRANTLPRITLIGKDESSVPHKNIDRVSEDFIFYLITDGELFFREGSEEYHLRAGDCFLFDPRKRHFGTRLSQYHLIYVHFRHDDIRQFQMDGETYGKWARERNKQWLTSAAIDRVPDHRILIPKLAHLTDPVAFSSVLEAANRALKHSVYRSENYNVLCAGAVNELFVTLYRQFFSRHFAQSGNGTAGLRLINQTIDYLNEHYPEKITGQRLSGDLAYNFDYLNQLFKKNLDSSVFQTLEFIRIENAKRMIQTTSLSLAEISSNVGYSNESYFSKVFKKHTGISPSQYRKQA